MIIFTIIGVLVIGIIALLLVLIAHEWVYEKSRSYRIFIDWLQLPWLVLVSMHKFSGEQLENSVTVLDKTHGDSLRWRIAKRAINKRIKKLNVETNRERGTSERIKP